jgi:hypothetical protein
VNGSSAANTSYVGSVTVCQVCRQTLVDGVHLSDRDGRRFLREERIVYGFLGWCLGVLTFAAALMVAR